MEIFKNEEQRELEMLGKLEQRIERREHRERIHRILIAGLALLAVAAFIGGHAAGHHCKKHRL